MTSALEGGGGSPKSRQKEQNQLISVCVKGGGENPKFLRASYMEAPFSGPRFTGGGASAIKFPGSGRVSLSILPSISSRGRCFTLLVYFPGNMTLANASFSHSLPNIDLFTHLTHTNLNLSSKHQNSNYLPIYQLSCDLWNVLKVLYA